MDFRIRAESKGFSPVAAARDVRIRTGAMFARGEGGSRAGTKKACLLDWLRRHELLVEEGFLNNLPPALTFDDPAAANATLPAHLIAAAGPGLAAAAVQQTMLGGLAGVTNLLPTPLPPAVDWNARLNKAETP